MSGPQQAMGDMADRLEGMLEELSDLAMDTLQRATSGDPDSGETGDALALERRILKARRALEKTVTALREGSGTVRESLDDGAV